MRVLTRWGKVVRSLHWTRGLRAGLAVAAAMVMCHMLGRPMGGAALGGFETILVDNGGAFQRPPLAPLSGRRGGAGGCRLGRLGSRRPRDAVLRGDVRVVLGAFVRVGAQAGACVC